MHQIQDVCEYLPEFRKLVLRDKSFRVEFGDKVLSEFICLSKFIYPCDGFNLMSVVVPSNSSITIFDNKLNTSPDPGLPIVRGILSCPFFPKINDIGETINDNEKEIEIKLTNFNGDTFSIMVYNFYSMFQNPMTTSLIKFIDKIEVINSHSFEITVNSFLIITRKDGVDLTQSESNSC